MKPSLLQFEGAAVRPGRALGRGVRFADPAPEAIRAEAHPDDEPRTVEQVNRYEQADMPIFAVRRWAAWVGGETVGAAPHMVYGPCTGEWM